MKMKLRIVQDNLAISPIENEEWVGTLSISTGATRYIDGHETADNNDQFFYNVFEYDTEDYPENWPYERAMNALKNRFEREYIYLPVYMYAHSGVALNTGGFHCPWDSGKVGYIYVKKSQVKKDWGWKRLTKDRVERIKDILRGEIERYSQYLQGDMYGFEIENEEGEVLDSCFGFYGTDWENNGLAYYLPDEVLPQLETVEIEYE